MSCLDRWLDKATNMLLIWLFACLALLVGAVTIAMLVWGYQLFIKPMGG